jgi:hypothetical protein
MADVVVANANVNLNANANLNANVNPPAAPYAICSYLFLVLAFGVDVICLSVLDVICSSILLVCVIRLIPAIIIMLIIGYFGLNLMVNCLYIQQIFQIQ